MLDDVIEKLISETKANKWISLQKLNEILQDFFQEKSEAKEVIEFLEKYFIEVDSDRYHVRLNDWAIKLFEKPLGAYFQELLLCWRNH
jgi:hypothetical protein